MHIKLILISWTHQYRLSLVRCNCIQYPICRFDVLLQVGVKLICGPQLSVYTAALRELAGQFYLMAGQFVHLCWLKAAENLQLSNTDLYVSVHVSV